MTIDFAAYNAREFRQWRTSVHNVLAYQRRRSRWWQSVGLWVWSDGDRLRGVVELGSITTTEFMLALRRLGEVRLRPIEFESIRTEVYAAARSISAVSGFKEAGRYQSAKIAIGPLALTGRSTPIINTPYFYPLPMLL